MTRYKNKRNGKRQFNAKELGQKIELKSITFLGQPFVIAAQYGNKHNHRYDLLGMSGTQLEGVLIKGVTNEALRKFRDDGTFDEYQLSVASAVAEPDVAANIQSTS